VPKVWGERGEGKGNGLAPPDGALKEVGGAR